MTEGELEKKVLAMATANHIWLNAFRCIHPTDELKRELGATILAWLDDKELLLPSGTESIFALTPMLYLSVNKS